MPGQALPLDKSVYSKGEIVTTTFYSGNPTAHYDRNNYFMSVEKQQDGSWIKVSDDHDWSTKIRWLNQKNPKALIAQLSWATSSGTKPGIYRMKHTGRISRADGTTEAFDTASSAFTIQ